jgi:hypothetical protein
LIRLHGSRSERLICTETLPELSQNFIEEDTAIVPIVGDVQTEIPIPVLPGDTQIPERSLTILQKDVVRTLAYFDVFSYPLSSEQVKVFLPRNSVTLSQLEESLVGLTQSGVLSREAGYYFLSDRSSSVVSARIQNERRALRMIKRARWISRFLKQVPFVRGIFITGSLSKNVAAPSSDVDFMIVTAPNRLWICKMILTGIRRLLLFNSIKYCCFNLFVTENGFFFSDQNVFNAIEIATTQVLWNDAVYRKFQSVNSWIRHFLPNWKSNHSSSSVPPAPSSFVQKLLEGALNLLPLDRIDASLMHVARKYWKRRNIHLDEKKFNSLFHCTRDISTVWYDDHRTRILSRFRQRLAELGIEHAA